MEIWTSLGQHKRKPEFPRLEAIVPSRDSRAMTRSPSPRAWRPDFPGVQVGCPGLQDDPEPRTFSLQSSKHRNVATRTLYKARSAAVTWGVAELRARGRGRQARSPPAQFSSDGGLLTSLSPCFLFFHELRIPDGCGGEVRVESTL